jgi:tRNA(Ile)-lysidine synthase TilS/MesJ
MKLYHITKQGTLHFQLKNSRLAAVYPSTGYVRVAHSLDGFVENRFRVGLLNRFNKAVENGNPGNITMWPINKRIKTKTMHQIHRDLYYKASWSDEVYKYPNKVYYEMESSNCELFPNDIVKLMDILTAFEAKNC